MCAHATASSQGRLIWWHDTSPTETGGGLPSEQPRCGSTESSNSLLASSGDTFSSSFVSLMCRSIPAATVVMWARSDSLSLPTSPCSSSLPRVLPCGQQESHCERNLSQPALLLALLHDWGTLRMLSVRDLAESPGRMLVMVWKRGP